eukprot:1191803-Prorocentrum_minimum.AAC.1
MFNTCQVSEVHKLGLLLRVDLGGDAAAAAAFVRGLVRSSLHAMGGHLAALRDATCHFYLSAEEEALYQHTRFELGAALAHLDMAAFERILQVCSHYANVSGRQGTLARSAGMEVERVRAP